MKPLATNTYSSFLYPIITSFGMFETVTAAERTREGPPSTRPKADVIYFKPRSPQCWLVPTPTIFHSSAAQALPKRGGWWCNLSTKVDDFFCSFDSKVNSQKHQIWFLTLRNPWAASTIGQVTVLRMIFHCFYFPSWLRFLLNLTNSVHQKTSITNPASC